MPLAQRRPERRQEELEFLGSNLLVGRAEVLLFRDLSFDGIRDLCLQAERGSTVPSGAQNGLLMTGQLVSIDEGNQAERVAIGLGAGRSDVGTHVQVYEVTPGGRRLIDPIEVDAKSGLTRGMAGTMGAGALTDHLLASTAISGGLHVASEKMDAEVVADADRAAKGIAKQLSALFAREGWTS